MLEVKSYIKMLKIELEKCTEQLIRNIKTAKKSTLYHKIELLDICTFMQPFELSILLYSMDKKANEVFYQGNDSTIFSGSTYLVQDIDYFTISENQYDEFLEFYEKNIDSLEEKQKEVIKNWFVACWDKSNGNEISLPVYFSFQDAMEVFDIQKSKWIPQNERWTP